MSNVALTSEFGESNLTGGDGEKLVRLNFKPQYRDVPWAIIYIVHVLAVIGAGAYMWFTQYPNITGNDDSDTDTNSGDDIFADISLTGIWVAVGACIAVGIIVGLCWLEVMKRFAAQIIWGMLILNIAMWCVVAVVGLATGVIYLVIIGLIFALINALYTWCVYRSGRIAFASALLSMSSSITSSYGGTVFISIAVIVFNVLWVVLWGSMVYAYTIVFGDDISGVVVFMMLVSFYWGFQVNANISHTTSCGVAATWYFSTEIDYNPTPAAFKRTMTTSFGSVALGSLMVAIIQAMKAMVRSAKNNKNGLVVCLVMCLLNCLERLAEFFNTFAYAHCAIYGTSFMQSAKMAFSLFKSEGITALINDDLTGMVLVAGALVGGIVTAGCGGGIGYAFYYTDDSVSQSDSMILVGSMAGYGFLIGFALTFTTLYVVRSAVVTLFVCFAEEPAALHENRPEEFQRLSEARPYFREYYEEGQRNVGTGV